MTDEEIIHAAYVCIYRSGCELCELRELRESDDCQPVLVERLLEIISNLKKERDTLLNDLTKAADNCKQADVFEVCFCCKKRNSCYYLGSSSKDMECEFEWEGCRNENHQTRNCSESR